MNIISFIAVLFWVCAIRDCINFSISVLKKIGKVNPIKNVVAKIPRAATTNHLASFMNFQHFEYCSERKLFCVVMKGGCG